MVLAMRTLWVVVLLGACGDDGVTPPPTTEVTDPIAVVDPTIGTGGLGFAHGSCFVGAVAPNGLVKLGPDTSGQYGTVEFLHYSGYWAGDDKIRGFSHLHLHGAGATDYGVLSVMPTLAFDPQKTSVVDYETRFAKADEHAAAGVYKVTLANQIVAELTATSRVGVHRYVMPSPGSLVIDFGKTLGGSIDDVAFAFTADHLSGHLHHIGGMSGGYGGYTLYFAIRTTSSITAHTAWATGVALDVPAGATTLTVGLSYVSEAGALANLDAEVGVRSFDDIVAATQDVWRAQLGVARITATDVDARIFYTSLYHAFLMPSVIDDADGTYRLIGKDPVVATGYHQMSDQSLWDTYRTVIPLYSWLAPATARDTARSLIGFGDGLGAYPRWPIAIGESGTMLGASAEIAIADTVARGVAGVDPMAAWPLLRGEALDATAPVGGRGERDAVDPYLTLGYVPADHGRSASTTTEYAHDDFALAHVAAAVGATADHDALLARSHGWQKLYDPAVGFIRAKSAAGAFTGDFDPMSQLPDYAEANAWQSLWMVGVHDPEGLATVLGGTDAAIAKLTEFFAGAKADRDANTDAEATGALPPPYYWHGNEPDLNAPFLFTQWGDPAGTQQWARWVIDTYYSDQPDGVAGNDDGGTLGSWYVLATLGLYPIAGSDLWILGAPRFPNATIVVGGHTLTISTEGTGAFVKSATLDGVPIVGPTLTHAQLTGAASLHVVLTQHAVN